MSIGTPNGILDITGATLRVSKMEFRQSTGFDTVLNNVARNTMLLMDETEQTTSNSWALKLPNAWVAEFHGYWASGSSGAPILFNFYNDSTSGTNGYTLSMNDTTISINYDGGSTLGSATLSSTLNNDAYRKVAIIFERSVLDVSVDGEHVFHFADSQLRDRVYDNNSGYVTFTHSSTDERKLKNLKFTNGDKWVREIDSSNIAYVGGNVGIGTTIPGTKLDVSGTVRGTHLMGDGSAISAIQSSNVSDFGSNVTRIGTLETDLGDNSSRITNLSSNLSDNSSRITFLETGNMSISGDKTFTGDIIFESNIHMNGGNVFVANTVNMTVSDPIIELGSNNIGANDLGIIMTRPAANSNVAFVYDESDDILRMGYTLNGASDSIVDLDSNALAVNVQGALSAGSNLEVGTANLFVDTSTSRVGIGMSNPSYTLDVDGDINLSTGSTLKINGTDAVFSNWTANGSDIYRSSGNVGIGTSNPRWGFEATPTGGLGGVLSCSDSPIFSHNLYYSGGWKYGTASTGGAYMRMIDSEIQFWNAPNSGSGTWDTAGGTATTTQRMTIDESGKVGIGTASPAAKFDVRGASHDPSTPTVHIGDNTADVGDYGMVNLVRDATSGGSKAHLAFIRYGNTVSAMGFHNNTNNFGIWTSFGGVTSTPAISIDPAGNVGIGTASPVGKLDVWGGASNGTNVQQNAFFYLRNPANAATNYGAAIVFENTDGAAGTRKALGRIAALRENNAANYSSYLQFSPTVAGTEFEAMRITSAGNVGIGTASPSYPLDVSFSGDSGIALRSTSSHTSINMYPNSGYSYLRFYEANGSSSVWLQALAGGHLAIRPQGGSETVRFNANGNVAIGTANPTHQLHIGPKDNDHIYLASSNNSYGWTIDTDDQGSGTVPFRIIKRTGGIDSTVLTIKNQDGKVGIGTTSPSTLLDVVGHPHTFIRKMAQAGTATNDYNHILGGPRPGTTSAGAVHFINGSARTSDGGTDTYTIRNDSGKLRLGNASFDTLLEGNVGIGVTSPSVALDISGQLNVSAGLKTIQLFNSNLTVSAGAWNDIGDFSGMSNGCYLLTVRWGNSSNPTVYWYGGASGVIYMRGDANATYNSQAGEDLRLNHWYHYRTVGEFEFILDSDNASGNYGNTTLWVKSAASTTINFTTHMTVLHIV